MEFGLIGRLDLSKEDIKSQIERLGGKLKSSIHEQMAAVISNEKEVEKMNDKMQMAKNLGIQIVPLKFLEEVKSGNAVKFIKTLSICDWGSDVRTRIFQNVSCVCIIFVIFSRLQEFLRKRQESSRRACIRNLCQNQSL